MVRLRPDRAQKYRASISAGEPACVIQSCDFAARAGKVFWMRCDHPEEELQAVFDGRPSPLPDRKFCGLCGEVTYLVSATGDANMAPALDVLQRRRSGDAGRADKIAG